MTFQAFTSMFLAPMWTNPNWIIGLVLMAIAFGGGVIRAIGGLCVALAIAAVWSALSWKWGGTASFPIKLDLALFRALMPSMALYIVLAHMIGRLLPKIDTP